MFSYVNQNQWIIYEEVRWEEMYQFMAGGYDIDVQLHTSELLF